MAQCNAKTKDGRLCQIPAQDGQRFCHIHRRQRLIRNVLSLSAVGALLLGAIGLIANIMGILGYIGINPESSPLPSPAIAQDIMPNDVTSTAPPPLATAPKLSVEPILVLHEIFANSMGCINGDLWVLPADSKDSSKISVGKKFDPSTIRDLVLVGPLMVYFKVDSLQSIGEEITVTDIAITVTSYTPTNTKVLLIGRPSICADPHIPSTKHEFYSRVSANTGALSLTKPKETEPTPRLFSIDTQSPLVFGMHINAVEPGWYEVKIMLSYVYKGINESVITDNAIIMYVPDQDEIIEAYEANEIANNGAISIFSESTTLLQELKTIREKRVVITSLESSLSNPAITGEYLRIQNLGKQQDLTGWKIETLFAEGQIFTFPNFTLPEWASVRIWSGQGKNGLRDLYWNLDSIIWSTHTSPVIPLVLFTLQDTSGDSVSGFAYDTNPPIENPSDTTTLPSESLLYRVIHVASNDQLNIRAGAGINYEIIGTIPPDGQDIQILGDGVRANNATWVPILYEGINGWVNSYYLIKQ